MKLSGESTLVLSGERRIAEEELYTESFKGSLGKREGIKMATLLAPKPFNTVRSALFTFGPPSLFPHGLSPHPQFVRMLLVMLIDKNIKLPEVCRKLLLQQKKTMFRTLYGGCRVSSTVACSLLVCKFTNFVSYYFVLTDQMAHVNLGTNHSMRYLLPSW